MNQALPTVEAQSRTYGGFPLDTSALSLRIPVTPSSGLSLVASRELGAWATVVLSVKWTAKGSGVPQAFSTPRTIAAGGSAVTFTEAELVGVDELVITHSSGALETAGATAMFSVAATRSVQYVEATGSTLRAVGSFQTGEDSPA